MNPVTIVRRHPSSASSSWPAWSGGTRTSSTSSAAARARRTSPSARSSRRSSSCPARDARSSGAWGRQLRTWAAAPRWYLLALLAPVVLQLLFVLANHGFGAPLPTGDQLADWPEVPVTFLVMLVFVGYGEEAGWIAFVAPVLLRRHGLFVAWVIAAAMRTLWHLPLMLSGDLDWVLGTVGNAGLLHGGAAALRGQ